MLPHDLALRQNRDLIGRYQWVSAAALSTLLRRLPVQDRDAEFAYQKSHSAGQIPAPRMIRKSDSPSKMRELLPTILAAKKSAGLG